MPTKSGLRLRSDRVWVWVIGRFMPGVRFFLFFDEPWSDMPGILVPAAQIEA